MIVRDLPQAQEVSRENQEILGYRWGEAPSRVVRLTPGEGGLNKAAATVDKLARSLVHSARGVQRVVRWELRGLGVKCGGEGSRPSNVQGLFFARMITGPVRVMTVGSSAVSQSTTSGGKRC